MADKYIPQVDYTSRDYASIRDDMINLIPDYTNNKWTNRDPADFGMTLLELFSYMGDILSHYIDRSANEAFIGTASQRDSVLQLAHLLGYKPVERTASKVTLTFSNSGGTSLTVPAKTQVATSVVSNNTTTQIVFETDTDLTVSASSSATVSATQGVTVSSEVVGTSNGQVNQVYKLAKNSVIANSVSVVVGTTNYTQVPYLIDYSNNDAVFSLYTDASGVSYILFGDNISGRVPTNNQVIYATYRVGGGIVGNVPASSIKSILTNNQANLSVSNSYVSPTDSGAATGGVDEESTDSIRINAPLSFRALNRAVSLSDYAALVKAAGASKASAIADVYSSVTVYFAPYGDSGVQVDGVTPTTVWNNLVPTITTYLTDKVPANTTVTLQPPSYANVYLTCSVTILPQFKQSLTQTAVLTAISNLFAFDNVTFQDKIYLHDVLSAISSVDGVAFAQIQKLVRKDQDQTFTINNKALTSNVATITTSTTHNITVGQTILVSGVGTGHGDFDGTYVVTAVGSNTISYSNIYTDVSSTSASGSATVLTVKDIVCQANEIPALDSTALSVSFSGGIAN